MTNTKRVSYKPYSQPESLMAEAIRIIKAGRIRRVPAYIKEYLTYKFKKPESFIFKAHKYKEFYHWHNKTHRNERRFEIPITMQIIDENKGKEILEIGNVLNHYLNVKWDVVDKYEVGKGVINEDILSYRPAKKYDLIVSISTIEHIGKDDSAADKKKCIKAVEKIRKMLSKNGLFVFTFLEEYNPVLSKYVMEKESIKKTIINVAGKGNLIIANATAINLKHKATRRI